MTWELIDRIAHTLLFEGYLLYPYRASAVKNQQRFNFGVLAPQCCAAPGVENCRMQTECLVQGENAILGTRVRFLHLVHRQVLTREDRPVDVLDTGGQRFQTWTEAAERVIPIADLRLSELIITPRQVDFVLEAEESIEALVDETGEQIGTFVRRQQSVSGTVSIWALPLTESLFRLQVTIVNVTPVAEPIKDQREQTLLRSLISTHAVLHLNNGTFASLLEPPEQLADVAAACRQIGCWPVLVGTEGSQDTMLVSPIILYDYPQVAEESPGSFFDGTEIDEMLTLRVLTMTPEEHREMSAVDDHARRLLERTQALSADHLLKMHGTMRKSGYTDPLLPTDDRAEMARHDFSLGELAAQTPIESFQQPGVELRAGDKVRLRPRRGGDIMDIALQEKIATIEAIEQDLEGNIHFAVVLDDDPGRDLGLQRHPGHRFFFSPDEVEPMTRPDNDREEP
jgi:hypothetical protein